MKLKSRLLAATFAAATVISCNTNKADNAAPAAAAENTPVLDGLCYSLANDGKPQVIIMGAKSRTFHKNESGEVDSTIIDMGDGRRVVTGPDLSCGLSPRQPGAGPRP